MATLQAWKHIALVLGPTCCILTNACYSAGDAETEPKNSEQRCATFRSGSDDETRFLNEMFKLDDDASTTDGRSTSAHFYHPRLFNQITNAAKSRTLKAQQFYYFREQIYARFFRTIPWLVEHMEISLSKIRDADRGTEGPWIKAAITAALTLNEELGGLESAEEGIREHLLEKLQREDAPFDAWIAAMHKLRALCMVRDWRAATALWHEFAGGEIGQVAEGGASRLARGCAQSYRRNYL